MSGTVFVRVRKWREGSALDRVDLYTRATVYLLVWAAVPAVIALSVTRPVRAEAPAVLIAAVILIALAVGCLAIRLIRKAFLQYLGVADVPRREVQVGAALTGMLLVGLLALGGLAGMAKYPMLTTALGCATMPFLCAYALIVPVRTAVKRILALNAVLCAAVWLMSGSAPLTAAALISLTFAGGWMSMTVRCSGWVLGVMYELREARDIETRLAVAEERLRFGRDLHDVLGRNLAVVALKSELAVQLARRDRPEAVEQMIEVQRIAQESQREVREVVRGYRETGLGAELAGAQGVLKAAGIDCRVFGAEAADALPPAVHAALGWVVREAATNVLRHGDAERCTVALRVTDDDGRTAVLTVENDGVRPQSAPPGTSRGSGLVGLRERLSGVAGALEAGPTGDGHFRLTAEVPLTGAPATVGTAPAAPAALAAPAVPTAPKAQQAQKAQKAREETR
ncbi:histidine kinase [Streptomyces sp. LHD-70]|uniref:sensor histidine kinase n=1 Tax=Streptomyces sp. LHD-70 TaxID=3072140 RepID=UPI00280C5BF8|nr:histidine kinase [Streptomyces sp. LHD-70]MDQ8705943.1 histidine kinase [Streptomyces sp. LHD-70]